MKRAWRPLLLVLATPLLMAGECEAPLVKDQSFDLWCGDMLCAWQRDEGTIAKAATWNQHDYGVALEGPSTRISQLLPYGSADVSCIHFDLLADIDADASVVLGLDFDDDGTIDFTQFLATGAWTPIEYRWVTPTYFHSVRLSISKSGAGRAVLARIQASKATGCPGAPPEGALARPAGATCEAAAQCASGACRPRPLASELIPDPGTPRSVCAGCATDTDCGAGTLCGLAWSAAFVEPYPACVAPPALLLGQRCLEAAECASGVCCQGVCSTCCAGGPGCAAGQACGERPRDPSGDPLRAAFQCDPGQWRGAPQTPCLSDSDCASGHCGGDPTSISSVCGADGRACTLASDCPSPDQNPCLPLGVAGGTCD